MGKGSEREEEGEMKREEGGRGEGRRRVGRRKRKGTVWKGREKEKGE